MSADTDWHVTVEAAERYVHRRLDPLGAASLETHLVACPECRSTVSGAAATADDGVLASVWAEVVDVVDRPSVGWWGRALLRVGAREADVRLVTATNRLRWAFVASALLTVALAVLAARSSYDQFFGVFLVVAPLGPLLATAVAFGRWGDPAHALLVTVPMSPLRMLLVRLVASVVPAIAVTALSLPWVFERGWLAIAWLLPSLALALGALALSTWVSLERAALALGGAWIVAPLLLRVDADRLVAGFGPPVQLGSLLAVIVAVVVTAARRSSFDYLEV